MKMVPGLTCPIVASIGDEETYARALRSCGVGVEITFRSHDGPKRGRVLLFTVRQPYAGSKGASATAVVAVTSENAVYEAHRPRTDAPWKAAYPTAIGRFAPGGYGHDPALWARIEATPGLVPARWYATPDGEPYTVDRLLSTRDRLGCIVAQPVTTEERAAYRVGQNHPGQIRWVRSILGPTEGDVKEYLGTLLRTDAATIERAEVEEASGHLQRILNAAWIDARKKRWDAPVVMPTLEACEAQIARAAMLPGPGVVAKAYGIVTAAIADVEARLLVDSARRSGVGDMTEAKRVAMRDRLAAMPPRDRVRALVPSGAAIIEPIIDRLWETLGRKPEPPEYEALAALCSEAAGYCADRAKAT
jgi:hypothetical protein